MQHGVADVVHLAFEVREDEEFVFYDGRADRSAELFESQGSLGSRRHIK